MKLYIKIIFLLLISNILLSQNWKIVRNKYVPINPSMGINLRSGVFGTTGLILGYSNESDSGTIRYNAGSVQYFNGATWLTIFSSADTSTLVTKNTPQVIPTSKYWTARQYMTSLAVDTIAGKTTPDIYITDTLRVSSNILMGPNNVLVNNYPFAPAQRIIIGDANYAVGGGVRQLIVGSNNYQSGSMSAIIGGNNLNKAPYNIISGYADSVISTGEQNYAFGKSNTIGRVNNTIIGSWLFGQYLRSENTGLWAFGSDDTFTKKTIPFAGSIVFVNEYVKHWGSNTIGLLGYMPLSYAIQSPRVKDTLMFGFKYQKYGNASDDTGYAAIHYELHRQFARTNTSGEVTSIASEGARVKRIYSINQNDDDAWHFNSSNTSGRPFGNIYVDSAHFLVSAGYADADSFRLNGSTFLNSTALSLGSKTVTTTGVGSFGALSGTTLSATIGTFVTSSNTNNLYLRRNSTTAADYSEVAFGVSTAAIYHASIRAVRGAVGQNGSLEFLTQKNSGSAYSALERRFGITNLGQLQVYNTGTPSTVIDSLSNIFGAKGVFNDSLRIDELGVPITKAVIDSNSLEFTANSVEYRALQNSYGELYISADPDTITMATAGVYYTTKDLDAGISKYVSVGDSSMTIKIAGYYHVTVSSSMTHSVNNTIVHFSFFKNDAEQIKMEAERKIGTGGDFGNASASGILYLAANDIVKIKYKADNNGTAIVNHFNFTVHRVD